MNHLPDLLVRARLRLLRMHYESRVGHIGGNLSALDMLMVLHHAVMAPDDVFILSKGHAAGALYVTLWSLGRLGEDDLCRFHGEPTHLSAHPMPRWRPEIPFATGSLGHGLSLSIGLALGKSLQGQPGRVFCMLSDGEMQEGSTWEALIFARQRRLAPLTILIDANGLQGFGRTDEVAGLALTAAKFCEFGYEALEIDGHDPAAIITACTGSAGRGQSPFREAVGDASVPSDSDTKMGTVPSAPRVIIAHTHKGRGVSFMQDRMEWHYLPMTAAQYEQAVRELGGPA